jgi:2-hydroxyglutarate dehydrogenase
VAFSVAEAGNTSVEVAVVGGGIVGLATARELLSRSPGMTLAVLEREREVGLGQTTWNSGVVHAGIYYPPGSLKAKLCVEGARALYSYCDEHGIRAERSGKLIIATSEHELAGLDELERRGRANGVPGLRRLRGDEIAEVEPHARGIAALHSPATGIVDFAAVARALRADVEAAGAVVMTGCEVVAIEHGSSSVALTHSRGVLQAHRALFCAGAAADRLAVLDGGDSDPRIVPFRGAYVKLRRPELVRSMIYPVPDPQLPFLGVHLTRHASGDVLIGPTALLVPHARSLAWPGTWRMMRRHWRSGLTELHHAVWRRALVAAARRFVPQLRDSDVERAFTGVRAQALARDGSLVDDFAFSGDGTTLHVRNAPSPAATSSLAIAGYIADRFG